MTTIPVGIRTVRVTGRLRRPDGTPYKGTLTFKVPAIIEMDEALTMVAGSATVTLDENGEFSVTLVATDQGDPADWTYTAVLLLDDGTTRTFVIALPSSDAQVDLTKVMPSDPAELNYVPVKGERGPGIISGSGTPTGGTGALGDFWLNTASATTWTLYGPKTSTGWPSVGLVLGDSGSLLTALNDHVAAADPHGDRAWANTKVADHVAAADPHGDRSWANTKVADHAAAADPHGDRSWANTKVSDHAAAADPHGDRSWASSRFLRPTTWRARDMPDPVVADATFSGTAPTITVAQTSTPNTGFIKYAPNPVALTGSDRRGSFTWAGATNFAIGVGTPDNTYVLPLSRYPSTYASGQGNWSLEFGTDAQIVQLRFKYIGPATMYRLSIDGRKVTDLMQSTGATATGSSHLLTIDFGTAVPRRLRFDFTTMPFGGVFLTPTAHMWAVPLQGAKFMAFGDSILDGSALNTGAGCGTWVDRVARMLGCTDVWRQGRGSTGYVNPGSFAPLGTRLDTDVLAYPPDQLVIWAGYNDATGYDQPSISAAATSLYSRIKTGLPDTQVYVIGCWSPLGTPAAAHVSTTATLRAAAAAAGFPFCDPQTGAIYNAAGTLIATYGPWITGTGNVGAVKGDGNADFYVGSDTVHPTDAGHVYLARRILAFLRTAAPA
ncbi:SGNH/GDSL hydrolase family protein [Streptomyces sp. NPDC051362]|uniref:SGNH/GDSL hydrolase family protein n=1 Tax=Streptomyces sp. NPDC051362 TaxID=3365651 RepID=UPI0037ABE11A